MYKAPPPIPEYDTTFSLNIIDAPFPNTTLLLWEKMAPPDSLALLLSNVANICICFKLSISLKGIV